jgi:ABC-type nitrate/sulfonate/bicarbonate transport system substrate-binding protein
MPAHPAAGGGTAMKAMPTVLVLTLAVTLGSTVVRADAGPQFNVGAVNNTGGLVVFVAVDKGFFAKHGIDGKVVVRNTGPELTKALDAGEIDFGGANVSNIPVALERGLDVKAIVGYVGGSFAKATDDNMLGIIAHPSSGITSIADLKGKKIGTTFGSMIDMYLVEVLRKHGMSEAAVSRINSTPAAMVALFDTGKVDAMASWEPYLTRMLEKVNGARLLVRGGDLVCFCSATHGKPEAIYRDRDATQRFVNAMAEAARFARDPKNLDEVGAISARYIPGMDADLIKRTHKYWTYDMRIGKNTFKSFNDAVEVLISQKKMKQAFDPAKYYDTSFIDRAMKEHPEWFSDLPSPR